MKTQKNQHKTKVDAWGLTPHKSVFRDFVFGGGGMFYQRNMGCNRSVRYYYSPLHGVFVIIQCRKKNIVLSFQGSYRGGSDLVKIVRESSRRGVAIVQRRRKSIAVPFPRGKLFRKEELAPKPNPTKVWWTSPR